MLTSLLETFLMMCRSVIGIISNSPNAVLPKLPDNHDLGTPSKLRLTRKTAVLARMLPTLSVSFVYYETIKRDLKIKPISECRCDEGLKTKAEESTYLSDTGLLGELEHLKIKTRSTDEKFASVMGACVI